MMDEGSETVVGVPWLVGVEAGMRVAITESGDGAPLIRWGPMTARVVTGQAAPILKPRGNRRPTRSFRSSIGT
jgi:hypothetical protein